MERLRLPLNPVPGITEMVSATELPCLTVRDVGELLKENRGGGLTVRKKVIVDCKLPDTP